MSSWLIKKKKKKEVMIRRWFVVNQLGVLMAGAAKRAFEITPPSRCVWNVVPALHLP